MKLKVGSCAACSCAVYRLPCRRVGQKKVFCNQRCYGDWRKLNQSGAANPRYGKRNISKLVQTSCNVCFKEFITNKYRIDHSINLFCSRKCMGIWRSINLKMDAHPNWRGGISKVPGYHAPYQSRRRARKLNADGSHTHKEWSELKKKASHTCLSCGKQEPDIKLVKDHVIPLSRGGTDFITNIQPLCKFCNGSKHVKFTDFRNKLCA